MAKESIKGELDILHPQLWESEQQLSNFSENIEEGMPLLKTLVFYGVPLMLKEKAGTKSYTKFRFGFRPKKEGLSNRWA